LLTAVWAKNSADQNKIRNLLGNGGIFIFLVTISSNDRVWYLYSNVTRATLLLSVSNGTRNETIRIASVNGNEVR
jgi:hypothetical protein